jgi:hypothetical protein
MTDDLSANTLEAVRKSMTVMSFMIIVYYFAGGHIPNGEIAIKLPLSNVTFEKPERLMYALWLVMAWWVYRYFSLGAYSEFKESFKSEWLSSSKKIISIQRLIKSSIETPEGGWGDEIVGITGHRPENSDSGLVSGRYSIYRQDKGHITITNELIIWRIRLVIATSCPSTLTFALPLILIVVAATLTII